MLLSDMLNVSVYLHVNEMVCTKTLYNYLHQGLLGVKAIDLPLVVRRSMRKSIVRKHKRELGQSIELRDAIIENS